MSELTDKQICKLVSDAHRGYGDPLDLKQLCNAAYALGREGGLRADAERYRWICRFPEDADYAITHALNGCDGTGDGPSFRDLLSDAIDAALAATGET